MSHILQDWLNFDVKLSKHVRSFEEDFTTGYLIGDLMNRFNHQPDFSKFKDVNTSNAKINNFVRLQVCYIYIYILTLYIYNIYMYIYVYICIYIYIYIYIGYHHEVRG